MTETALPLDAAEALKIIANVEFRAFEAVDFDGFAGIESNEPLYGEYGPIIGEPGGGLIVILDGPVAKFFNEDGDTVSFELRVPHHAPKLVRRPNSTTPPEFLMSEFGPEGEQYVYKRVGRAYPVK